MADSNNDKFSEARRIYQDVSQQVRDANDRLGDPLNPNNPKVKDDRFTRDTGDLLQDKIYKQYGSDPDRSLNYRSNPKFYGR